ncbi:MAG: patatin-like phospholipase family protein, partial [Planctomycetota bacterium]|nr:patatin-like phospholipase family protein [Planctomycetota bacterium]
MTTTSRALFPRRPLVALLATVLLATGASCSPGGPAMAHLHRPEAPFREVGVDLSPYRSVQERPGQDPTVGLALACSGGGMRAANLTAGVLLGLEELQKEPGSAANALREVDYFSSVSGGGLGVGAYLSSLHDFQQFGGTAQDYSLAAAMAPMPAPEALPPPAKQRTDPGLRDHLAHSYARYAWGQMMATLTGGRLHRGHFIERAFDDRILGHRWREGKYAAMAATSRPARNGLTVGDLFPPAGKAAPEVRLPIWCPNATALLNGSLFVFTPEHLRAYKVIEYFHRLETVRADVVDPAKPRDDAQRRAYEEFIAGFPMGAALAASNSFPLAVPPPVLRSALSPDYPYLYLTDGGLADNLGVYTALRMLKTEPGAGVRHKGLIVLDARNDGYSAVGKRERSPNILMTAAQIPIAQLRSWHGRFQEVVEALCKSPDYAGPGQEIHPVFLGMTQLSDLTDCSPLRERGLSRQSMERLAARAGVAPAGA